MLFECLIMVFTFYDYCYLSSLNGNQVLQLQEIMKAHCTLVPRTHSYYSHFSVFRFIYLFIFLSHFQVGYNH